MKILHVGDISFVGSMLCREMRRRKLAAAVLSKAGGPLRDLKDPWIVYRKNFMDELNLCGIDPQEYDVIHAHYLINWGSLGLRLKNIKRPILLHAHGADLFPSTPLHRFIQRAVAAQSKFMLYSTPDLLKALTWFKGRTIYLPNPVEIPELPEADRPFGKRILIYGTLYRFKKIETLFPRIEQLPYQFDLIDFGPDSEYTRRRLPKNAVMIAPFPKSQVNKELIKYKLVLGGSQDGSIRMCELEAMALGIPTLFPFRYNDFYKEPLPMPGDWLKDIGKYVGDRSLGQQQRQWVERYHRVEVVVDQLLQIYERVKNKA